MRRLNLGIFLFILLVSFSLASWPMLGGYLNRTSSYPGTWNITALQIKWKAPIASTNSHPVAYDIDSDGKLEIIIGSGQFGQNNYYVFAIDDNGTQIWNYSVGDSVVAASAIDDKIYVPSNDGYLYALYYNGSLAWNLSLSGWLSSSPAIADLDGDGNKEIILCGDSSSNGTLFVISQNGTVLYNSSNYTGALSSPAIADLDGDGKLDVVFGAYNGFVYAMNGSGLFTANTSDDILWEYNTGIYWQSGSISIADVDGDSSLDVLVGTGAFGGPGILIVLNSTGGLKWNYTVSDEIRMGPAVGDVEGDGSLDLVFGSYDDQLYILNSSGSLKGNYSSGGDIAGFPLLIDVDGAPSTKEIIFTSKDGLLYIVNGTGDLLLSLGNFSEITSSPIVQDIDADGHLEMIFGSGDGNLYCFSDGPQIKIAGINYTTKMSNITSSGIGWINVTINSINLSNVADVNFSHFYLGTNITIFIKSNQSYIPYTNVSTTDLTNGTGYLALSNLTLNFSSDKKKEFWVNFSLPLGSVMRHPETTQIQSPNISYLGNYTYNITSYLSTNQTLNLNIYVQDAGLGVNNSNVTVYLFNSTGHQLVNETFWSSNQNETWNASWVHTFNESGDYPIVILADRKDGLPAWWRFSVHVRDPVNLTVGKASPGTKLEIKKGDDFVWKYDNASDLNLDEMPNTTYYVRVSDPAKGVNVTFNSATFSDNPHFFINKTNSSSNHYAIYGFDFTGISGSAGLWFNLTGLGIHDGNLTVYKCSNYNATTMKCSGNWSKVTSGITKEKVTDNIVHELSLTVTGFSGYKINETSSSSSNSDDSSSSSSSSDSSSSSGSGGSGGSGGGGGSGGSTSCTYDWSINVPANVTTIAGNTTTFKFKVINTGTCVSEAKPIIEIRKGSIKKPDSWFKLSPTSKQLDPNDYTYFTVTVTPTEKGNYTIKVGVSDTSKTVDLYVNASVEENTNDSMITANLDKVELNLASPKPANYSIIIKNPTNETITANVSLIGNISSLVVVPSSLEIKANSSTELLYTIDPSLLDEYKPGKYSGQLVVDAGNQTIKIPVTITLPEKKLEKAGFSIPGWVWVIPVILVMALVVLLVLVVLGVIAIKVKKGKPKRKSLASLR